MENRRFFRPGLHYIFLVRRRRRCDFGRGLGRKGESQPGQDQLLCGVRLGVARERQAPAVGGGSFDVEHLDGLELFEDAARGQAAGMLTEPGFEGDEQAVRQKCDEDVRLNAFVGLVMNGPKPQVLFDFLEGLFDFGELDVQPPELGGVLGREVRSQQVTAFARAGLSQLGGVEAEGELTASFESSPFLVETLHGSSLIRRLLSLSCSSSRSSVRVSAPREAWRGVDTL